MRRRYNTTRYLSAVDCLRSVFPSAALTTDILTGFPGETEAEFLETADIIRKVGFSRIHVFPYSPRPNTPAADMPGQLSASERQQRARMLISIGEEVASRYRFSWLNRESVTIPEELSDGCWEGYTPEYLRVRLPAGIPCAMGRPVRIRIIDSDAPVLNAEPI